jgi:hypothetical protein
MSEEFSPPGAPEPLLAAWIKWTMDFWDTMAQMGPGMADGNAPRGPADPEAEGFNDPALLSLTLWQAFFSLLTEPDTVAAVFRGIAAPSETTLRMAQAGWSAYSYLHRQWLEGWDEDNAAGDSAYETLDQDIFNICRDIHEKDFRQVLNLPHLSLTGLPPEQVNRVTEKFHQFQAAMAEFIYLLYLPVKKSLRAMRRRSRSELVPAPPEEFKEYYKQWLKLLEGYFMTLFQSPEYIRTLSHALNALADFTAAKQELMAGAMNAMGLPTRQELKGLYREIYLLKKNNKEMAREWDRIRSREDA